MFRGYAYLYITQALPKLLFPSRVWQAGVFQFFSVNNHKVPRLRRPVFADNNKN
jgi:hypothetical protein